MTIFNRQMLSRLILVLFLGFIFTGCFATSRPQPAPPVEKRAGIAPKAAMLPILNTNDTEIAEAVGQGLVKCLSERNVLDFVAADKVSAAVKEIGVDLTSTFGPSNADLAKLADQLNVDYTLYGVVTVRKDLKFTGWRKDVDVYISLHDDKGKDVDSWRSMTGFTWAKESTELDARKMAQSAINHTCAKMLECEY